MLLSDDTSHGFSCKFYSFCREIGFLEKVIDRGIYLSPKLRFVSFDPGDEILRFGARDSPTFAIYETFRVLGNSGIATVVQSVSFTISFYFLLCITCLMVGLYPAVERILHAKI